MSKEKRAAFTKEAHGLTGEHLIARMKAIVIQETEIENTISLEGDGKFLDSPNLTNKKRSNCKTSRQFRKLAGSRFMRTCNNNQDFNGEVTVGRSRMQVGADQ